MTLEEEVMMAVSQLGMLEQGISQVVRYKRQKLFLGQPEVFAKKIL